MTGAMFLPQAHLFLRSSKLVLLRLGTLLPLPDQTCITTSRPQLLVRILRRLKVSNLALLNDDLVADRERMVGTLDLVVVTTLAMLLDLLLGRLALLRRLRLAREEHEAGLVGFEALNVGGERLFREVLTTRVDGDADCWRQFAGDAGFL